MEILNDRAYVDAHPEPQAVVWERMNLPIARGLRGLLYVLWDLSQVDPSDLSACLPAGAGCESVSPNSIRPSAKNPGTIGFRRRCEVLGQSVLRLQRTGRDIARLHSGGLVERRRRQDQGATRCAGAQRCGREPLQPALREGLSAPRPWGVTTLFAEYTGNHPPLEIGWTPTTESLCVSTFCTRR